LGNGLGNGLGETKRSILQKMKRNPQVTGKQLADTLKISTTAVEKNIKQLREAGIIQRIGGTRGHWEVLQ
jgi:ATP-dependent DNA helicase RecG